MKSGAFTLFVCLATIFGNGVATTTPANPGITVTTQEGPVSGQLVLPTVRQFLGIPYASAGRWEAPVKPAQRNSTFQATSYSNGCLQLKTPGQIEFLQLLGGQGIDIPEGEDCLTVNIWAPSTSRQQNTAVLIWIHGGGAQIGSSHLPIYNGSNLVRDHDDIILVTFNYRLNLFGQPNAPQLASTTASQNFGYLDQTAAIQWVHDNIAAFGGDPNRITLFGQSAGGVAGDAYAFAHPNDTIVKGIIQQSGNQPTFANPSVDAATWNALASAVGCGTTADAAQLTCMKAVPAQTLESTAISNNFNFQVIVDDIYVFSDYPQRTAAGNFLKVPILAGSALNDGDLLTVAPQLTATGITVPFATQLMGDIFTELGFTCPAGASLQGRLAANVPAWRYQYQAMFANLSPRQDLRAFHASEIPLVFGTFSTIKFAPPSQDEIGLSRYMQSAWVAFARDPVHGLTNFGWPVYNPTTASTAQLGNIQNITGTVFTQGALLDLLCTPTALGAFQSFVGTLTGLLTPPSS
ncbi:carboxylesterase [Agrocybe pediades]|nr:carboxylesterase [Agrocybe pediades]